MDYTKLQFRSANGDGRILPGIMGRNSGGIWDREQSQLQFIVKILKINDVIRLKMQGLASQSSVPELKRKQDCGQTTKYIEEGGEASFRDELSQASYLHMQRNIIISLAVNVKV